MPLFVSIIIPCRNEEKYIGECLDSILEQDFPQDQFEILIADGMSTDKTREILQVYANKYAFIRWFDNPGKIVPTGLNKLIRQAKGEVVVRLDSHADYPKNYISQCVHYLIDTNADNVGGVCITLPGANTLVAKAIAQALSCAFGMGDSSFRIGVKDLSAVDTVPFGCFRRAIFDKIGMFDEELVRSQDCELNHRIIKNGGKILLIPNIISYYYARETFSKLAQMYSQYGYFKAFTVVKLGGIFTVRQLIPAIFVGSILLLVGLGFFYPVLWWLFFVDLGAYVLANILFSVKLSLKEDIKIFPLLVWAFFLIHMFFGFNYLRGIFNFWIFKIHLRRKIIDLPTSR